MRYGLRVFLGLILLGMASVAVILPRVTASPVVLPTVFVLPSLTPFPFGTN